MNEPLSSQYTPDTLEKECYTFWEQHHYFSPHGSGKPYCIMLPPPNVTGSLHMGHGFQHTLMDILTRYHRMQGDNTLWQPGTDHAGISTQMVVERQLLQKKQSRHDLGRDAFVEAIWQWKKISGSRITEQMRVLGTSCDWTRERFTLDEGLSAAVNTAFVRLYEQGLIYRAKRLVNWDPKLLTAISDLEVLSEEEDGFLWHIRYPVIGHEDVLVVATTRPETLLGDTAVAVHPEDTRYQHLIGAKVALPLTDRTIPIIADDYVDREFGTGVVKITPGHDFNDYDMGLRHDLPILNILTADAHLNEEVPSAYRNLDRFIARERIVADLSAQGLLIKIEPHRLNVPRGDRSGVIIEPYLTDQWFVRMSELAKPAIAAVKEGKIRFVPENWQNTYFQWLDNIHDWCISRQLWWGHRIPAWYDDEGHIFIGQDEDDVRTRHKLKADINLRQDEDVLDTWFSSALWPFSTLGWPENTPELKTFYPTSVLVTGFDILFFWVARMIMMGLNFLQEVPFKTVYITGLIRDHEGQKMSKTKGNVLDPLDLIYGIDLNTLIEKRLSGLMQPQMAKRIETVTREQFPEGIPAFGTDALRFTFCALASNGRNIRFDLARLSGYRNFCNKLWNAARFILMHVTDKPIAPWQDKNELSLGEHWLLSRLQHTIKLSREHLDTYRFDLLAQQLYEFSWDEFCDWGLEWAKSILQNESAETQKAHTRYLLVHIFETLLTLLHPIIPFITEKLWLSFKPLLSLPEPSLMVRAYPHYEASLHDTGMEELFSLMQTIIVAIRNIRVEMNIAPGKPLALFLMTSNDSLRTQLSPYWDNLKSLARLSSIACVDKAPVGTQFATAEIKELTCFVDLADLIDIDAEKERLNKEKTKLEQEIAKCKSKLDNPQ
ncbi:MAG: valine--tRNA ligase, partial [Gammaproteobacteria bacterium]|nr:valine--tRNA ligase [Gammaproteobacteria bacterium]